jgi:transposase-like protein
VDLIGLLSETEEEVVERRKKHSPEFREQAVRRVIDTSRPIAVVARELGVVEGTLGNWVNVYRREHAGEDLEPPLSVSERARLRELERENRELRMQTEFLKKAAAYFARDCR